MNEEFGPDIITLVDDEGQEHEFELLLEIEHEGSLYYALLPTYNNPEDVLGANETYYIFEVTEENGEQMLAEVEDDDLLDTLAEIFEETYYGEDENEESAKE